MSSSLLCYFLAHIFLCVSRSLIHFSTYFSKSSQWKSIYIIHCHQHRFERWFLFYVFIPLFVDSCICLLLLFVDWLSLLVWIIHLFIQLHSFVFSFIHFYVCFINWFLDIDECKTIRGVCQNGRCINIQGSYRCDCFAGYNPSEDHKRCLGKHTLT